MRKGKGEEKRRLKDEKKWNIFLSHGSHDGVALSNGVKRTER